MGKKKLQAIDDPELAELQQRKVDSVAECEAAVQEAYRYNAQLNSHRAAAAKLEAKITILSDKVIAYGRGRELPLVNNAWPLKYGQVKYGEPGSKISFADGITIEVVIKRLREKAVLLKAEGINVRNVIEKAETVKFDALRKIPKKFHKQLGYLIEETPGSAKLVFAESDTKKKPPARRKPS